MNSFFGGKPKGPEIYFKAYNTSQPEEVKPKSIKGGAKEEEKKEEENEL